MGAFTRAVGVYTQRITQRVCIEYTHPLVMHYTLQPTADRDTDFHSTSMKLVYRISSRVAAPSPYRTVLLPISGLPCQAEPTRDPDVTTQHSDLLVQSGILYPRSRLRTVGGPVRVTLHKATATEATDGT